jgi:hypothetical protein
MKILSEKEIQKLSAEGKQTLTESGAKVQAFKYQRPPQPEKRESKVNWLKGSIGTIAAAMQAASHERKTLNGLVTQIAATLAERLTKSPDSAKTVDMPKKWVFTVLRDERGHIKEIEAKRGE